MSIDAEFVDSPDAGWISTPDAEWIPAGDETTVSIDALIQKTLSQTFVVDSLIQKTLSQTLSIDAILRILSGTICWGHSTGVVETVTDYLSLWTGSGTISGTGDAEKMSLLDGENMTSPVWNLGAGLARLSLNKYNSGDDVVTKEYRTAATIGDCGSASWNNYSNSFTSLGYVQLRLSVA